MFEKYWKSNSDFSDFNEELIQNKSNRDIVMIPNYKEI